MIDFDESVAEVAGVVVEEEDEPPCSVVVVCGNGSIKSCLPFLPVLGAPGVVTAVELPPLLPALSPVDDDDEADSGGVDE